MKTRSFNNRWNTIKDIIERLSIRYQWTNDRGFNAFLKKHGELELIRRREIVSTKIEKFRKWQQS